MINRSLFNKARLNSLIKTAQDNLTRDKFLEPVIFINTSKSDKTILIPFITPQDTHDSKLQFITTLHTYFKTKADKFGDITEAILLTDAYYLESKNNIKLDKRVRDYAERKEAITLQGRNITGDKFVSVMLKYDRDNDKLKFSKPQIYLNDPKSKSFGLIDYLFNPQLAETLQDRLLNKDNSHLTN